MEIGFLDSTCHSDGTGTNWDKQEQTGAPRRCKPTALWIIPMPDSLLAKYTVQSAYARRIKQAAASLLHKVGLGLLTQLLIIVIALVVSNIC